MKQMRSLLDDHNIPDRDFIWDLMASSKLFQLNRVGEKVFLSPDYNLSMEDQRESTLARVLFLLEKGVFKGWLTKQSRELELQKSAIFEAVETFDHALAVKLGIHFRLWYKICPCMSNSFPHFVPALHKLVQIAVYNCVSVLKCSSQGRCHSVLWDKATS